ncbi:MAG: hypothetical protein AAF961_11615, partial [Planctomycetota bacterium]
SGHLTFFPTALTGTVIRVPQRMQSNAVLSVVGGSCLAVVGLRSFARAVRSSPIATLGAAKVLGTRSCLPQPPHLICLPAMSARSRNRPPHLGHWADRVGGCCGEVM